MSSLKLKVTMKKETVFPSTFEVESKIESNEYVGEYSIVRYDGEEVFSLGMRDIKILRKESKIETGYLIVELIG